MTKEQYTLQIIKRALIEAAHWRCEEFANNSDQDELVARNAYYNILDQLDDLDALSLNNAKGATI